MGIKDVFSGRNYCVNTYYKPVFEDIQKSIDELKEFSPEQMDIIESIIYSSQDFILDVLRTNPLFKDAHKKLKPMEYFILHAILFSWYWLYARSSFKNIFLESVKNIKDAVADKVLDSEAVGEEQLILLQKIFKENPKTIYAKAELIINQLTGCDILKKIQTGLFKQKDAENTEELINKSKNLSPEEFQYVLYCNFSEICGCKPLDSKNKNVLMFWVKFHLKSQEYSKALCNNAFNKLYLQLKAL